MLLNLVPLRVATAAGAATVVAGAAFGVAAFADEGGEPEAVTNEIAAPDDDEAPFFHEGEVLSGEELEAFLAEAEEARNEATSGSSASSSSEVDEEEEEEEEEDDAEMGDVPSGSPKEIAQAMLSNFGWGGDQWSCLDNLWEKESNWNHTAQNPSSGAYGIPQSLPGDKMASSGSDWRTNPATQIDWGLGYIDGRYGSPCAAWSHSQDVGWY